MVRGVEPVAESGAGRGQSFEDVLEDVLEESELLALLSPPLDLDPEDAVLLVVLDPPPLPP